LIKVFNQHLQVREVDRATAHQLVAVRNKAPAALILPVPGFFGNAGRNTIPGPGMVSLNASFGRSFGLGERRALEFRFDGTNVLNQVNISTVGTTLNSLTYGLPLSARAMRSISATLRFRF